jgi:hypothetical protein
MQSRADFMERHSTPDHFWLFVVAGVPAVQVGRPPTAAFMLRNMPIIGAVLAGVTHVG